MGTEFWWILDAAIVAIALIIIFISIKKGASKKLVIAIGCVLSLAIAGGINKSVSGFVYKNAFRQSTPKSINKAFEDFNIVTEYTKMIEKLDYNVRINEDKLEGIIRGDEVFHDRLYTYLCNINGRVVVEKEQFIVDINESFANMLYERLSTQFPEYVLNDVKSIADSSEEVEQLTRMLFIEPDETVPKELGVHIEEKYIKSTMLDIISVAAFVVLYVLVMIFIRFFAIYINNTNAIPIMGKSEDLGGAIFGLFQAVVDIVIVTYAVKFFVVIGKGEMLVFNEATIEKTYLFKYIYNLPILEMFR